jgi:hypothetical protein
MVVNVTTGKTLVLPVHPFSSPPSHVIIVVFSPLLYYLKMKEI